MSDIGKQGCFMTLLAENLSCYCKRSKRWLFKNVSFEIDKGQVVGVYGDKKCGKACLARALASHRGIAEGELVCKDAKGRRHEPKIAYIDEGKMGHRGMRMRAKENVYPFRNWTDEMLDWYDFVIVNLDDYAHNPKKQKEIVTYFEKSNDRIGLILLSEDLNLIKRHADRIVYFSQYHYCQGRFRNRQELIKE